MAGSSEFGAEILSELQSLSIDTEPEVKDFRVPGPRRMGDMKTVTDNIQTSRGQVWVSRKRMRSDALRLFNEGQL